MSHKLFINFFLVGALRDAENVHKEPLSGLGWRMNPLFFLPSSPKNLFFYRNLYNPLQ